jgi:hypothetical protein
MNENYLTPVLNVLYSSNFTDNRMILLYDKTSKKRTDFDTAVDFFFFQSRFAFTSDTHPQKNNSLKSIWLPNLLLNSQVFYL